MQKCLNTKNSIFSNINSNLFKIIAILMVQVFLIASCSEDEDVISPNGTLKIKEVVYNKSTQINSVELSNGIIGNIEFDESLEESVISIETSENILDYVEIIQSEKNLKIKLKDNKKYDDKLIVKCKIKVNNVGNIKLTSKSNLTIDNNLILDTLSLDISGGSTLTGKLVCKDLTLTSSGNSTVNLNGNSINSILILTGNSKFTGFDFIVDEFTGNFSGESVGSLTINKKLSLNASGASILNYKGNPEILQQVLSGGSFINKL